jgi:hypothetical protein
VCGVDLVEECAMNTIKVKFLGFQVWRYGRFALYNLLEPMGEHPVHSTVSLNTIKLHGFTPVEMEEVEV